jgi:hypothetical protein
MIISKINPSPEIESIKLGFPIVNNYGIGICEFSIKAKTLLEPRLITFSCFKEPFFAIRGDLSASTGELIISIGPTNTNEPQSKGFLFPRYIKDIPEHFFEVNFQNWKVEEAKMDGTALQAAPVPSEIILIYHEIEQVISVYDLLRQNGSIPLELSGDVDSLNGLSLFLLNSQSFVFQLLVDSGEFVLRRSYYEIRARPESKKSMLWISWSPTLLQIMLPNNKGQKIWSLITPIVVPPKSLLQLARIKKLQPTTNFATVEAFRTAVHEALCSLEFDIAESGAYNGFWDQSYKDKRKGTPKPKRETDIHQQILLPLYDWAKMRSIEIIPENETAVGKLDVCLIGNVEGQGPVPFCVEVKLAHAKDLEHGLDIQLPEYMTSKRAMYGVYFVLWFKGIWFDSPSTEFVHNLRKRIVPGDYEPLPSEFSELDFALVSKTVIKPQLRNIRVFLLDVSKPISASKKR